MISVLHFSTSDSAGGSARSARRIHEGLLRLGHRSRMLVGHKGTRDAEVDTTHGGGLLHLADRVAGRLATRWGRQYAWLPSTGRVMGHPWLAEAQVIQLFNTHGGYLATPAIARLARRKPLVWRLSDMWPATGHCAYAGDCQGWLEGCRPCPHLDFYPPLGRDGAGALWRMKRELFAHSGITMVAPSSWAGEVVRRSPVLAGLDVRRIPNGIDLEIYRPEGREKARAALGLSDGEVAVLFSAHVAGDNPRKGSDRLVAALNRLAPSLPVVLVVAGIGGGWWRGKVSQKVMDLGYLEGDRAIADANRAADVVIAPSAVENLPNTVLEAVACGVPVVAFDAGGMKDAVIDGHTGLLVPAGDEAALAAALERLALNAGLRRTLGEGGRSLALAEFDREVEVRRFVELYRELLERRP